MVMGYGFRRNSLGCGQGKGEIFEIASFIIFMYIAVTVAIANSRSLRSGHKSQHTVGKIHAV